MGNRVRRAAAHRDPIFGTDPHSVQSAFLGAAVRLPNLATDDGERKAAHDDKVGALENVPMSQSIGAQETALQPYGDFQAS